MVLTNFAAVNRLKIIIKNVEALANDETEITAKICLAIWGECIDDVKAPYVKIEGDIPIPGLN